MKAVIFSFSKLIDIKLHWNYGGCSMWGLLHYSNRSFYSKESGLYNRNSSLDNTMQYERTMLRTTILRHLV